MKIFNEKFLSTAKVLIVKSYIGGVKDLTGYISKLKSFNINSSEVVYIGLFDEKPTTISTPELREKLEKLTDMLKVYSNFNIIVDSVSYIDNKNKYQGNCIFSKIFNKDITLWKQNGVFEVSIDDVRLKLIAGFRGNTVKREMESRKVIDSEFKVKAELCKIITIKNKEDAIKAFKDLNKSKVIAVDTEASGLKPYAKDFRLYTIQMTGDLDKNLSYVFMYDHPKCEISEEYKDCIKKGVKWILESGDKKNIWIHNASYDILVVNSVFNIDAYKVNIFDSMIIYHFLTNTYKAVPLGLKDICFKHGIFYDWDSDLDKFKKEICGEMRIKQEDFKYEYFKLDDLLLYAGYDTICLMHLIDHLYIMSKEHPAFDVIEETWNKTWKSIMCSLYKVMINGLPFNMDKAIELRDSNDKRVEEIDKIIEFDEHIKQTENILNKLAYDKALLAYDKKVEEALRKGKVFSGAKPDITKEKYGSIILNNKFSSTSLVHKRVLLFDVLKLKSKESTDSGLDKVSDDILMKFYEENPDITILKYFSEKAKILKSQGTYVLPWIDLVSNDRDGRLRSTFNPLNSSGRLRGNSPNLLNITREGGLKELIEADYTNGMVVGQIDVNALEERAALLAHQDKIKMKMKEEDVEDMHSVSAITISKAKNDGILAHLDATTPADLRIVKKEFPHLRQNGKALTFGISFGCTWRSIAYTYKVSETVAKKILEDYWNTFKGEAEFYRNIVNTFSEQGYGVYHGNVPILCKGMTNDLEDNENLAIIRTVYNGVHQSSAYAVLRALDKSNRHFEEIGKRCKIFLSVYDSIIFECHIDDFNYCANYLYMTMSEDFMPNQLFPLQHEVEIGLSYKAKKVVSRDIEEQIAQIEEFKKEYL